MGVLGMVICISAVQDCVAMPLGDPHGGNFEYTVEGLPQSIAFCAIPVRDVERALSFYCDLLGFGVVSMTDEVAFISRGECRVVLRKSDNVGIDTGLFLAVDCPYNTRRRLMDQGVVFVVDPVMGPFGTYTSFRDDDGNVISVIDCGYGNYLKNQ